MWEDNVENVVLGKEPNNILAYDTVLKLYLHIMSMIRGHGVRLDIERKRRIMFRTLGGSYQSITSISM